MNYRVGRCPLLNSSLSNLDNIKLEISSNMSLSEVYMEAFYFTQDLLNAFDMLEDDVVNIRALVEKCNVELIEQKIIRTNNVFQYGVQGYLDCFNYKPKEYKWTIYINEEMGDLTKRYTIAHELAHYFLKSNAVKYCRNPLFPKTSEEQLCDIIASFLLMPIKTVFRVMDEYIEKCKQRGEIPIVLYDWLEYLSATVKVSHYHTVTCFQNVRYLGGILFEVIDKSQVKPKYKNVVEKMETILREHEHLFR